MGKSKLQIDNLAVEIDGKEILNGFNLTINAGEIHALMGPNGAGKSTLASAIMGHPKYNITNGEVFIDGLPLLEKTVDERAKSGLFLAMQYPAEITGVTNSDFLRSAINSRRAEGDAVSIMKFIKEMDKKMNFLEMKQEYATRYVNEGFSGGEKKRNEILQMMMIKPKFAILDEIDSGLDIDALKIVSKGINEMRGTDFGCLLITHYQRLLDYVVPDFVHVIMQGKIVKTGGADLALRLEAEGYDWIKEELGIVDIDLNTENALK